MATLRPRVGPPVGFVRVKATLSFASAATSGTTGMLTDFCHCPAAKVMVFVTGNTVLRLPNLKSIGGVASIGVSVTWTVTGPVAGCESVIHTFELLVAVTLTAWLPSGIAASLIANCGVALTGSSSMMVPTPVPRASATPTGFDSTTRNVSSPSTAESGYTSAFT